MPNFVKIGQSVAKILRFFSIFQDGGRCHLESLNLQNFIGEGVRMGNMHHCTKFRQNRVFCCRDIAIFQIFKMAAAAILDF